jgi:lysozyme family protein
MTSDQIFELALTFTLGKNVEGGLVTDQGGKTDHGVTQTNYSVWLHSQGLPNRDVSLITDQQVHDFYYQQFWTAANLDKIAPICPLTTVAVFDFGVNAYWRRSVSVLQGMANVAEDGNIGPRTVAAVTAKLASVGSDLTLSQQYNELRRGFYTRLAQEKPEDAVDLKGWENRVNNLDTYISTLQIT